MQAAELEAPTLLDLLARLWSLDAPISACAYDAAGRAVAFALADGRLAIAPAADTEPVAERSRIAVDTGLATVSPRRRQPPPIEPFALDGEPMLLVPAGADGFLAGCGRRLFRIENAGLLGTAPASMPGPVKAMAPLSAGGALAAAAGTVYRSNARGADAEAVAYYEGHARAIVPSPDGSRLAVATDEGIAVTRLDTAGVRTSTGGSPCVVDAQTLAWSPDGRRLAAGGPAGVALFDTAGMEAVPAAALGRYPDAVGSLAFSRDGRWLVTGGGHRIIAWDLSGRSGSKIEAATTGTPRFRLVRLIALHPARPLVAAGYDDGMIVVAKVGQRDELVLRGPGDGAVAALAWSPDGSSLAFGTEGGLAGIAGFPPQLFK